MIAEAEGAETLAATLRARLHASPPGLERAVGRPGGDHALDALAPPALPPRLAAVLVPIVLRARGPTVLLTERAAALRSHSGQIAFPGGKIDPEDASALHAALREAEEEIGLARRHVRPIGFLDPYLSSSNYLVTPAVALVAPAMSLTLNPFEVASTFEVPLGFLMDARNHEMHAREWNGSVRQYYAMPFGTYYIWGLTAGVIRNMYERLHGTERPR